MADSTVRVAFPRVEGAIGYKIYSARFMNEPIPRTWVERLLRRPVRYKSVQIAAPVVEVRED
jgi:hypothetical protein